MSSRNPFEKLGFADEEDDKKKVVTPAPKPAATKTNPFEEIGYAESDVREDNPFNAVGYADEEPTAAAPEDKPGFLSGVIDQLVAGTYDVRARHATSSGIQKLEDVQRVEQGKLVIDEDSGAHKRLSERRYARQQEVEQKRAAEGRPADVQTAEQLAAENAKTKERLTTEAGQDLARGKQLSDEAAKRPMADITNEFMDPKSERSGWEIFLDDPVQIIADIGMRSMPSSLEAGAAAAVGAGAGPIGFGMTMGLASGRQELANTIADQLTQRGVDITDPAQIKAVFDNPDQMKEIMSAATKRSVAVGGFDALAGLFGGKMLTPFKGALTREAANVVAQGGVQAGLGAAGETVGQMAEGKDQLDPRAIAAEAAGELVSAPVEVAEAGITGVRESRADANKPGGPGAPPADNLMRELEERNLAEEDAHFVDSERHAARKEAAAAGGDALDQELAAARAGAEVGGKVDLEAAKTARQKSEQELQLLKDPAVSGQDAARVAAGLQPAPVPESPKAALTPDQQRMAANRAKVDAETTQRAQGDAYAGTQVEEDAARSAIQAEAAAKYEQQVARKTAAPAHAVAESRTATQRDREFATAEGQRDLQVGEKAATEAATAPTLGTVAPAQLKDGKAVPVSKKPATIAERRQARMLALPKPQPATKPAITVNAQGQAGVAQGQGFGTKATEIAPVPEQPKVRQTAKVKEASLKAKREARIASRPARVEAVRAANAAAVAENTAPNLRTEVAAKGESSPATATKSTDTAISAPAVQESALSTNNGQDAIVDASGETSPVTSSEVTSESRSRPDNVENDSQRRKGKNLRDRREARRLRGKYRLADSEFTEGPSPMTDGEDGVMVAAFDEKGTAKAELHMFPRGDNYQIKLAAVQEQGQGTGQQLIERAHARAKRDGRGLVSDSTVSLKQLRAYQALKRKGWTIEFDPNIEKKVAEAERLGLANIVNGSKPVVTKIEPPSAAAPVVERNAPRSTPSATAKSAARPGAVADLETERALRNTTVEEGGEHIVMEGDTVNTGGSAPASIAERRAQAKVLSKGQVAGLTNPAAREETLKTTRERLTTEPKTRGVSADEAKAAAKPLLDELPGLKPVILGNESEAPEKTQAQMLRDGVVGVKALYDTETDTIYVFANNHESTDDVIVSILHEGIGHKGLRYLLGDDFDGKMREIGASIENSVGFKRIARDYGYDLENQVDYVAAVDEYIAELAEKGSEASFIQRVYDLVRAALRAIGLGRPWSDNDIRSLLRDSRKNLKRPATQKVAEAMAPAYRKDNAFKRWFGDSKVVDKNGDPLIVYHGTLASVDFDEFSVDGPPAPESEDEEPVARDSNIDETAWMGVHFAKETAVANYFAGNRNYKGAAPQDRPRVIPAYIRLENPMRVTESELRDFIWQHGSLEYSMTDFYLDGEEGTDVYDSTVATLDGAPSEERAEIQRNIFSQVADRFEDEGKEAKQALAYSARSAAERLGYDGIIYDNEVEGGTSFIVFHANQIKSAVGNVGTYSNEDARIQYRLGDEKASNDPQPLAQLHNIAATMESQKGSKQSVTSMVKDALANTTVKGQRPLLSTVSRQYLPDFVSPEKMPAVRDYVRIARRMDGRRNELMSEAEPIGRRWNRFVSKDKKQGALLSELMHASTLAGVDPSEAYKATKDMKRDAKRRGDYVILRKAWEKLGPEGQKIYTDAKEFYGRSRERVMKALEDRINASNASGQTKKALITELREKFEAGRVQGPYFPLMRFGDFWAAARDKEGEVISFSRFEQPSQQRQWVENMKKQGFVVEQGQKTLDAAVVETVSPDFAARVTDLAEKTGDKGLADEIWQLYLRTLPEMSMRKAFMHRKGRLGFSADAMRAFGHAAFHGAHQTARLEYMHTLEDNLTTMRGQAARLSDMDDKERFWATNVYAEMADRHEWSKNPQASAWATALTSLGFAWYLGTTPAAAMVNLTQTPMVALPVLGAQFGMARTAMHLARAAGLWAGSRGPLKNRLRGDERTAFEEAERIGLFDKTQAHDLAGLAEHGLNYSSKWRQAVNVMSYLFHKTESANRETTFLAAYRMGREKGLTHDAAILKAEELTWDSHFDYANTNRPRLVRGNIAKVLFLFKNYSLNMTYRLIRDFNDSIRGATPQARSQARKRFGGIMMQTAMMSGLTGLPVVWMVARLLESAFDEPDDPYDAQEAYYAYLAEQYGSKMAMLIMRGPVDAALGGTVSSRVSLSQLWFREPDANLEPNELFAHYLSELAGPIAGIAEDMGQASVAMQKTGDPFRALEYFMPKFLEDQLKAMRYLREGAQNYGGESYVTKDEFTNKDLFLQSLGFTPTTLQQRYDEIKGIRNTEARILARKQALMDQLFAAARHQDKKGVQSTMAEIAQFDKTNPGAAITVDTIMNSASARQTAAETTVNGARVTIKQLRYLHQQMKLTDKE